MLCSQSHRLGTLYQDPDLSGLPLEVEDEFSVGDGAATVVLLGAVEVFDEV